LGRGASTPGRGFGKNWPRATRRKSCGFSNIELRFGHFTG
jgi:hypothetical protein